MSLFRWLSQGKKQPRPEPLPSVMPSSGLSRMDSTKPFHAARHNGNAQAANRKHERMARREMLYGIVREAMVRASVLSSSYKFKVLSLDPHGRNFMVMVDLSQDAASDTSRLAEIEAVIAQTAKARHDILVTAVYWRANDYVAIGDPQHGTHKLPPISQPAPLMAERPLGTQLMPARKAEPQSAPAPLSEQVSRPAELRAAPPDPLHPSEVAAFKQALNVGLRGEQALAAVNAGKAAPQNYTLLTGFEDTEMAAEGDGGQLSATQYGGGVR